MVMTRSASSSPVKKRAEAIPTTTKSAVSSTTLEKTDSLRLLICPDNITSTARILSLPDPVDGKAKRFLFCQTSGLYELKIVAPPKQDPHSILFANNDGTVQPGTKADSIGTGFINEIAAYMTATPCDLAFVLLKVVQETQNLSLFQTLDDILDAADELYDLRHVTSRSPDSAELAMQKFCETVDGGEETMYRYNDKKALAMVMTKAQAVCRHGLPASLEDKFVTRTLETPVLSIKREDTTMSVITADSQASVPQLDSLDSQSSVASVAPSVVFSEVSVAETTTTVAEIPTDSLEGIPDTIKNAQRLMTAFKFICASYLPAMVSYELQAKLYTSDSPFDFSPLTKYLETVKVLRAQAAASTDMSCFSRKRGSLEDDEIAEMRAEKKRKTEEEEKKKKANTSRGVKDLAKVDTKGMKKMSSFFTKIPVKPKT